MTNVITSKEPFVRIAKRDSIPFWMSLLIRVASVILALIVCAGVIYALIEVNPLKVYKSMAEGAFGTFRDGYEFFNRRTWITLRDTMMLLCIAVGLAPAFKMRFWNIGAEGQILVGGIATAACMIYLKDLPPVL
ncbi:MAG: ABC transporter permease, partial [Eubacteriales bacterium]|nr:ABC transporter permease [Eubacteriales bacterium]